jgi:hypothetical protein
VTASGMAAGWEIGDGGEVMGVERGIGGGGCLSLSPMWVHRGSLGSGCGSGGAEEAAVLDCVLMLCGKGGVPRGGGWGGPGIGLPGANVGVRAVVAAKETTWRAAGRTGRLIGEVAGRRAEAIVVTSLVGLLSLTGGIGGGGEDEGVGKEVGGGGLVVLEEGAGGGGSS